MVKFLAPVFALLLPSCAALTGTKKSDRPSLPETVLFDVDLTGGNAGAGQVTGGTWDKGWQVTGKGDRIVFDAGHPVAAGYLEASFTISKPPHGGGEKVQWIGLHEDASLSQAAHDGDIFYARVGDPKYKFSRVKAGGRKFDESEWEKEVGAVSDWKVDDTSVQTVRLEWREGRALFRTPDGAVDGCPKKLCGGDGTIDELRYAFLGSDKYTDAALVGIRFTRVKLVEYGK